MATQMGKRKGLVLLSLNSGDVRKKLPLKNQLHLTFTSSCLNSRTKMRN